MGDDALDLVILDEALDHLGGPIGGRHAVEIGHRLALAPEAAADAPLRDALQPLQEALKGQSLVLHVGPQVTLLLAPADEQDRKSTRLNSSHVKISYAVFC